MPIRRSFRASSPSGSWSRTSVLYGLRNPFGLPSFKAATHSGIYSRKATLGGGYAPCGWESSIRSSVLPALVIPVFLSTYILPYLGYFSIRSRPSAPVTKCPGSRARPYWRGPRRSGKPGTPPTKSLAGRTEYRPVPQQKTAPVVEANPPPLPHKKTAPGGRFEWLEIKGISGKKKRFYL